MNQLLSDGKMLRMIEVACQGPIISVFNLISNWSCELLQRITTILRARHSVSRLLRTPLQNNATGIVSPILRATGVDNYVVILREECVVTRDDGLSSS